VTSSNKKDGRKEAAEIALRQLMAEGAYQLPNQSDPVCHQILFSQKESELFSSGV
jgi:hypothetical protein